MALRNPVPPSGGHITQHHGNCCTIFCCRLRKAQGPLHAFLRDANGHHPALVLQHLPVNAAGRRLAGGVGLIIKVPLEKRFEDLSAVLDGSGGCCI